MTSETNIETADRTRKRKADGISGGIFLICLGVLVYTGWWWPGIMVAIGLSSGASLIFRGQIWRGILSFAFFVSIPIGIWIITETQIPWTIIGPLILIGIGVIVLVKALFFREG
jgi:hypothetical protein